MGEEEEEEEDELELEAMRKDDFSWHPCKVSKLSSTESSTSVGLTVSFDSQNCEDTIYTEKEAVARIRFRSIPLQGDDCSNIKEGEHVLAIRKTQCGSLFFDAQVEKVHKIRHLRSICCRCTFGIKWIHHDFKGDTVNVPSSSIRKISRNGIHNHPTVAAFLSSLNNMNCSILSSSSSLLEDSGYEAGPPIYLERQMEEISKLADTSMEGCSQEILLDLKRVDFMGEARQRMAVASQASFVSSRGSNDKNISRRSTRSQSKVQLQISSKNPHCHCSPEESNHNHLSPLRARAALASLMHELTTKSELSVCDMAKKGTANKSHKTFEKHANAEFVDVDDTCMEFDTCTHELPMRKDITYIEESHQAPFPMKESEITESLTSNRKDASNKSLSAQGPGEMNDKPAFACFGPEDKRSFKRNVTCSETDKKLSLLKKATRLARSSMQKRTMYSDYKVELNSSLDDAKLSRTPPMRRLTRSAILRNEEDKITVGYKDELNSSIEDAMSSGTPMPMTRHARSATVKKEDGKLTLEHKQKLNSSNVDMELSRTANPITRVTRSAVLLKEQGNLNVEFKQGLDERKSAQGTLSESSKETRKKNLVTPVVDSVMNLSLAQDGNKRRRVSSIAPVTRKKGEISGNAEGRQVTKKTFISCKKKAEVRSSPRFRFLPRTRSQNKSPIA